MKTESKAPLFSKSELNKQAIRSSFIQASFNYERMQGSGWVWCLQPVLRKIYKDDPEKLRESMKSHAQFFNTHPFLGQFIMGVTMALEENGTSMVTVQNIKVALMGPLGGIGDSLLWLTVLPILAAISSNMALNGAGIMGAIFFLIAFNTIHLSLRFALMHYGYSLGLDAVSVIKEKMSKINRAASIIGLTIVGSLIPQFVNANLGLEYKSGEMVVNLQTDLLDKILPGLLPALIVFFFYKLYAKGTKPLTLIIVLLIIGVVFGGLGILV